MDTPHRPQATEIQCKHLLSTLRQTHSVDERALLCLTYAAGCSQSPDVRIGAGKNGLHRNFGALISQKQEIYALRRSGACCQGRCCNRRSIHSQSIFRFQLWCNRTRTHDPPDGCHVYFSTCTCLARTGSLLGKADRKTSASQRRHR